ncbi:D-2-hydroxyacid dehydrogenase [Dellaglioa sp. P0083]|uniref:D-2-hydroxyacid dehydrogenase n=1 Tax=Dellaglioa kimchii TaxID=3344667 RepID=UPI0038D5129E
MKLIAFGMRKDEVGFGNQWSDDNQVDVEITQDLLTNETIQQADGFDGIIALQTIPYNETLFSKMKEMNIKILSVRNVGVDNIDLVAAKKYGVTVTNVPAYSPNAIAEFSVTQLMQLLRRTPEFNLKIKNQDYRWAPNISRELRSLTVGVIGTGRIGRVAMDIYKGFGAKVIAYDVYPNAELKKSGIYVDTLDELFEQADVVTLHTPATKENEHMLNRDSFEKMKHGVLIVNTARGTLINTEDLIDALKSGQVGGAALDTYEFENPIFNHDLTDSSIEDPLFNELLDMVNVILTPHIAFYTETAVKNMVEIALNSAYQFLTTGVVETEVK